MRFISPNTHGIIDYLISIILIVSPWLLGFYRGGAETWVPVGLGIITIIVSLITDYKYSISKTISMQGHLIIDFISGVLLAISPWLFGFSEYVYLPHLIFGLLEIGASLTTQTKETHTSVKPKSS